MTRIISIVSQKGGVGKTTTAINLSTALAAVGKRTLLIDLDPQGNASTGMGIDENSRVTNIYDVFLSPLVNVKAAILKTLVPKLEILTANVDLAASEVELSQMPDKEYILKNRLRLVKDDYDFIIIDSPPSLGMLTINALTSCDSILIPLQCEFFALQGLSNLLETVKLMRKSLNKNLEIQGIVLTMYDKRTKFTEQIELDVKNYYDQDFGKSLGEYIYETVIPRNIRISEAPSHGKPAIIYDVKCPGSIAYMKLAKEILDQIAAEKISNRENIMTRSFS